MPKIRRYNGDFSVLRAKISIVTVRSFSGFTDAMRKAANELDRIAKEEEVDIDARIRRIYSQSGSMGEAEIKIELVREYELEPNEGDPLPQALHILRNE